MYAATINYMYMHFITENPFQIVENWPFPKVWSDKLPDHFPKGYICL